MITANQATASGKAPLAPVRVRYAPSPTGAPPVGNIRAALFDWLLARATGGAFILRIEDTDQARTVPGATERIMEALRWLGLDWDEGPEVGGPHAPYIQSERQALGIYQEAADRLLAEGKAYHCYCTPERLDEMRKGQQARKEPPRYDHRCRDLTAAKQAEAAKANPSPVVRFAMPLAGMLTVHDAIRGEVDFDMALLDDFVIMKSDAFPTYHLAHIVDDHAMEITHVLRGEEWLPSLPRHQKLYEALGYTMPVMAHLPLILGPDRSKLSKRHGARATLELRDDGYLPDALVNFLALLGWSLDDHSDVITRENLIANFSLERVASSPAIFDTKKLEWFNGMYMRAMTLEDLAVEILPLLEAGLPEDAQRPVDPDYLLSILPLEQERLKHLTDAPDVLAFFFVDQPKYNPIKIIQKGMVRDDTREAMTKALALAKATEPWDAATLETAYRALAEELGVKTGQLFGAIRIAITGGEAAPPLFDTMEVLGKERVLKRLTSADYFLGAIPIAC